jgi:hypothetical protein
MNKEDEKQQVLNQFAYILNYQPTIGHQHINLGNSSVKDEPSAENVDFEEVKNDSASAEKVQNHSDEAPKERNYFAPTNSLQILLKQDWFNELRTKDVYDEKWTDSFVSSLMSSEWKDNIASDWFEGGKRRKVPQIKGHIVGLLADVGVLKGSYDSIARKVGIGEEPRTFARYMGQGKKQPYADWVRQYVTGEKVE